MWISLDAEPLGERDRGLMTHAHHDWFIAGISFAGSLLCIAYCIYEIRKDRRRNR